MTKIFVDTDVILDILIARADPMLKRVSTICIDTLIKDTRYELYTSPLVISNISYILCRKDAKGSKLSKDQMITALRSLIKIFKIIPMDSSTITGALLTATIKDVEDMFQYIACMQSRMDAIVTRNVKDYTDTAQIPIYPPVKMLQVLKGKRT